MLAVIGSTPANGVAAIVRRKSSASAAPPRYPTCVASTTNSSPPQRKSESVLRTRLRIRVTNSVRTVSPVRWPWVSLTRLK